MKKLTAILISILLLAVMILPASATEGSAAAAFGPYTASGAPGSTVSVTLSLSGFSNATGIAVQVNPESGLTMNSESCSWLKSGILSDFNASNGGVWTAGAETDINGSVATLVFTVPTPVAGQTDFDYSYSCSVQVMHADGTSTSTGASGIVRVVNPATALALDKASLSLDMNGNASAALTATVTPANSSDLVVWTTSDSTVVTVSNGVVTAKKSGSATVTATAGSFSASCAVTVTCSHDLVEHAAAAPTCQAAGNNLYYTCNACGVVLDANKAVTTVEAQTLAKVDHAGGTATCTAKAVCSMCGQSYGEMLAHTYATAWSYDENGHWKICTGCNTAKTSEGKHDLKWVTDKAPTEDEAGYGHNECSCGYKTGENTPIDKLPHAHVGITHHAAVAATCTTKGNVEYWTCSSSKCSGKFYGDENCYAVLETVETAINEDNHVANELKNVSSASCYQDGYTGDTCCKACGDVLTAGTTIEATGKHTGGTKWYSDENSHWHVCTTTGCTAKVDQKDHSFTWVVDKEATEDETGLKHEECACGYKRSENTVIQKLDHVHVGIQHHAAVPATCVKEGTVEYWTCSSSKCTGKFYGDAKCQVQLDTIVETVNAENHTGATELKDKVEPTCSKEGYSGDTWCTSCKAMVQKGEVVPATGKHIPKKEYEKDEKVHWQLCQDCDAIIGNAKAEHTFTWVFDKKPTEQATGIKHQECTACGYKTSENTTADKLKHVPVRVEAVAPTCEEDGMAEHFYCANCGSYYVSTDGKAGKWTKKADLILAATGHVVGEEWLSDENNHWHGCTCELKEDEAAHTFELVGALEATETEPGYTGDEVCSVCGYVKTEGQEIPCIVVEETTEPAQEETAPVITASPEQPQKSGRNVLPIVLMIAAAALIVLLILILRKKK